MCAGSYQGAVAALGSAAGEVQHPAVVAAGAPTAPGPKPPHGPPAPATTSTAAQRLQAALERRLPPASILQLDAGYLVVRRCCTARGNISGAASCSLREHRYQKQLQSLRLLARLRLALPPPAAGEPAEQRFCSVAAAFASRTPPQQQP